MGPWCKFLNVYFGGTNWLVSEACSLGKRIEKYVSLLKWFGGKHGTRVGCRGAWVYGKHRVVGSVENTGSVKNMRSVENKGSVENIGSCTFLVTIIEKKDLA